MGVPHHRRNTSFKSEVIPPIDIQWDRAEKYARQFAFRHFENPDIRRVENLRNKIFEYIRRRDLKMDYFETSEYDSHIYCFTCLEYMPKFHFC